MELTEFKSKLKSKNIAGAYLFIGEEEYLKRFYLDELRRACGIDETFALFNHTVFDGIGVEQVALAEAISSPPMMSDFKLVEWKYAKIGTGRGEITIDALTDLAKAASDTGYTVFTVTVSDPDFDLGTEKRPSKALMTLSTAFEVLRFEKSTESQLMSWIKRHFDSAGIEVTRAVAEEMLLRTGHSMDNLKSEIDKLTALMGARKKSKIDISDVKEVCSSNIEADAFALKNALSERNKKLAFTALYDLKSRKVDATAIINSLASFYSEILTVAALLEDGMDKAAIEREIKIHPYRLKMCIASASRYGLAQISKAAERLSEIDAKTKSQIANAYTSIEMFIAEFV